MTSTLVFVYNADSGLFDLLTDWAHKVFAPATYPCRLCALTYGNLGMRREWKEFIARLELPSEFLHADELKARYGLADLALPAVFKTCGDDLKLIISRETLETCKTLSDLEALVLAQLEGKTPQIPGEARTVQNRL